MFAITAITAILAASASLVSGAAIKPRGSGTASVTPHDLYNSQIGVLGCKINTNRVAYWPTSIDCNNLCLKVSYSGRSVYLLKVDQSQGAYDISYDAWNYLKTGKSATEDPVTGGGEDMDYEEVHASKCSHLLKTSKLAFSAPNSMNYIASCISEPNSWVAKNYQLWNIEDSSCKWGIDEKCTLDLAVSNQPSCPSGLGYGASTSLDCTISNVLYGTGEKAVAA